MFDWKAVFNLLASSAAAGVAGGAVSLQTQPVAPWQVHAGATGIAALTYFVGHLRQSPLPVKN